MVVAMLVITVLAAVVLVYVAVPHREHEDGPLAWVTGPLSRLAERVRPQGAAPPQGLLSRPERDEAMSRRFERAEQRLTHPFRGTGD